MDMDNEINIKQRLEVYVFRALKYLNGMNKLSKHNAINFGYRMSKYILSHLQYLIILERH